jgi:hypothetical protein
MTLLRDPISLRSALSSNGGLIAFRRQADWRARLKGATDDEIRAAFDT